jgi:hypothetical protein
VRVNKEEKEEGDQEDRARDPKDSVITQLCESTFLSLRFDSRMRVMLGSNK